MITITNGEWIADLGAMLCRNISNNIVVAFEKSGRILNGRIKDIPMEVFAKWAGEPDGEKHIQKVVMDAEEVFLRAYFENDIEKNGIKKQPFDLYQGENNMGKRLCRSSQSRILFGVCGGIAEYFNIEPWIVRLIFIFTSGGAGVVYLILAIFLPTDDTMQGF